MSRAILLAGPQFTRQAGGLERALADLASGLAAQGFVVDDATGASAVPEAGGAEPVAAGAWFSKLNRSPAAATLWSRLSPRRRRALRDIFAPRAELERAAQVLDELERRLARRRYDTVLYCIEEAPPGGLALAQARHRCVIPMAIEGLAAELEGGSISGTALRARGIHPWLGRRADARSIRCAILSSRAWAAATVRAGLSPDVVHAVYFGVPLPAEVRAPRAFAGRLLYVGRLVKEKGVHVLLDALARARRSDPRLTLTLVTGEGPHSYRSLVRRRIAALGLERVVDWRAPVPRAELAGLFADHDALLFWSPVPEPAPLVAMNAMAAGLPVIVPAPAVPSPIYEDAVTCIAYARRDAADIAGAIARLARDAALGATVAAGGAARIRDGFTPEHMARRYAELLEATIAAPSAA
jgi:glycosyltransferase involved in cell wall biosynthesis